MQILTREEAKQCGNCARFKILHDIDEALNTNFTCRDFSKVWIYVSDADGGLHGFTTSQQAIQFARGN